MNKNIYNACALFALCLLPASLRGAAESLEDLQHSLNEFTKRIQPHLTVKQYGAINDLISYLDKDRAKSEIRKELFVVKNFSKAEGIEKLADELLALFIRYIVMKVQPALDDAMINAWANGDAYDLAGYSSAERVLLERLKKKIDNFLVKW